MHGVMMVDGIVTQWKAGFAKVKLPTYDDVVTEWLPIIKARAMNDDENWALEPGELVKCLVDAHCVTGCILGAISNDVDAPDSGAAAGKWRKSFSDGTVIEYDKGSHKMAIVMTDNASEVDVTAGSVKVNFIDGGAIEYDGASHLFKFNSGGGESMHQLLKDVITVMSELIVPTPAGNSSVPLNISVPGASGVTITALLTRLETLLSA